MDFLKVTIRLSTPMVEPGDLFHLDALLGALRVDQARAEFGEGINPRDYHHDLPLDKYSAGEGDWVFKASAFTYARELESQNSMQTGRLNITTAAKHRDEGFLLLRAAKPNIAGGPFKTSIYQYPVIWATLTAYCVGEQAGIAELLSHCRQVGGRRGVGSGQVAGVSVEVIDENECVWSQRAMPENSDPQLLAGDYAKVMASLRGPYWDRTLHQPVLAPTELRQGE